MHCLRLSTVIVLSIWRLIRLHAQKSVNLANSYNQENPRRDFTISFAEHIALSTSKVFVRRFGLVGKGYNLSTESFEVYVPADYQPGSSYELFAWIGSPGSGTVLREMKPILDKHCLIWIGANRAGNNRTPFWHRFGLAVDAAYNMKKRYSIDVQRVYIGGHSGGGRSASGVAIAFPEHFYEGCYLVEYNYFRRIEVPSRLGEHFSFFRRPHRDLLQTVMEHNRYVRIAGEHDFSREEMKATYDAYKTDGFKHVTYKESGSWNF